VERLGIALGSGLSPADTVECARLAEQAGYESAWVVEGHGGDQFSLLTAIALATTRIRLGTAISSVFVRTAPTIAMAAACIDHFSNGRFVLGLGSSHKVQVEVEHGVVLAVEHHEADGIAPDLIHDLTKRHEVTCPLGHFDRLAGAQELHELDELDVEFGALSAQCRHRRLHAFDVAAVVGAPDIDQRLEAAVELRAVVGDVRGEVGIGAVGFLERTVHIVAECGRAEQGLIAVLPVLDRRALRRRQSPFIDVTARTQPLDRLGYLVGILSHQQALGIEDVMVNAE